MTRYRQLPISLATMLRSIRMGYRVFHGRYFLRISKERFLYRIDLAPFSGVDPKHKTWDGNHFCWWETEDEGWSLVQAIPCLRSVVSVHKPISFLITETGAFAGL